MPVSSARVIPPSPKKSDPAAEELAALRSALEASLDRIAKLEGQKWARFDALFIAVVRVLASGAAAPTME